MALPVILTIGAIGAAWVALGKARKDMPTTPGETPPALDSALPNVAPDAVSGASVVGLGLRGDAADHVVGSMSPAACAEPGAGQTLTTGGGFGVTVNDEAPTGQESSTAPSAPSPRPVAGAPSAVAVGPTTSRSSIVNAASVAKYGNLKGVSKAQQGLALQELGAAMGEVF